MYFVAGINTKHFLNIPKKIFVPLRILYSFIKSLVSPFADIASTFSIVHLIPFQKVLVLFYLK